MSREDLVLLVIWLVAWVGVFMCICLWPEKKESRDIESGAESSTSLPETRAPVTTFQEDQTNESQNLCSLCKNQFSSANLVQPSRVSFHQFHFFALILVFIMEKLVHFVARTTR